MFIRTLIVAVVGFAALILVFKYGGGGKLSGYMNQSKLRKNLFTVGIGFVLFLVAAWWLTGMNPFMLIIDRFGS